MSKKILALLSVLTIAMVGLTACGKKGDENKDKDANKATTQETKQTTEAKK